MANLHEIKARIGNVNATKKITRAMYLISASKSQKAKGQLESVSPYFQHVTETMVAILAASEKLDTPYISYEQDNNASDLDLYLVLGGDKGMAGGYNHNILEFLATHARKEKDEVLVAGFISRMQIRQEGYKLGDELEVPVMNPNLYRARDVAELVVEKYLTGRYRAIFVIYTKMISALKQEPDILPLLPLDTAVFEAQEKPKQAGQMEEEIEYRPSAREVFDNLVPHYLKGVVYGTFVEAFASEQHARMYAMDGATNNANDTIAQLSISYNRARQAKITQELTEIVGGIPQD